jgi:hypothetical protein
MDLSRGLGDVYKRQELDGEVVHLELAGDQARAESGAWASWRAAPGNIRRLETAAPFGPS